MSHKEVLQAASVYLGQEENVLFALTSPRQSLFLSKLLFLILAVADKSYIKGAYPLQLRTLIAVRESHI